MHCTFGVVDRFMPHRVAAFACLRSSCWWAIKGVAAQNILILHDEGCIGLFDGTLTGKFGGS